MLTALRQQSRFGIALELAQACTVGCVPCGSAPPTAPAFRAGLRAAAGFVSSSFRSSAHTLQHGNNTGWQLTARRDFPVGGAEGCMARASLVRAFSKTVDSEANPAGVRPVDSISRPPSSLEVPLEGSPDELSAQIGANSPFRRILWLMGYHSHEALNIRAAARLYEAVCTQCDANTLHDSVQLEPSFFSRWCLLSLHVWMLLARLRAQGQTTKILQQELYDLFQEDVEVRVRQQISARISSVVEELEKDFYGNALAMDRAVSGEQELWEPMFKNFYSSQDGKECGAQRLAAYTRRELQCLELTQIDALMQGRIKFSDVSS